MNEPKEPPREPTTSAAPRCSECGAVLPGHHLDCQSGWKAPASATPSEPPSAEDWDSYEKTMAMVGKRSRPPSAEEWRAKLVDMCARCMVAEDSVAALRAQNEAVRTRLRAHAITMHIKNGPGFVPFHRCHECGGSWETGAAEAHNTVGCRAALAERLPVEREPDAICPKCGGSYFEAPRHGCATPSEPPSVDRASYEVAYFTLCDDLAALRAQNEALQNAFARYGRQP